MAVAPAVPTSQSPNTVKDPLLNTEGTAEKSGQSAAAKKNEFKITLQKVDAAAKAKVIREIKNTVPGMNLVEAKAFVESCPRVVKEKLSEADAEKLKQTLESLGAVCSMD